MLLDANCHVMVSSTRREQARSASTSLTDSVKVWRDRENEQRKAGVAQLIKALDVLYFFDGASLIAHMNRIVALIKGARSSIDVSMYAFTHHPFALEAALTKIGVELRVFVDYTVSTVMGSSYSTLKSTCWCTTVGSACSMENASWPTRSLSS